MHEVDSDSDILVMPKPHARKKSARNLKDKFFILTSDEAYAPKVKQKKEKRRLKQRRKSVKRRERS